MPKPTQAGAFSTLTALIVLIAFTPACSPKPQGPSIAVFVPGLMEESLSHEMMDSGVRAAADKAQAVVKTIEGGSNRETWSSRIAEMTAEGTYDLIVTANPAMSEIIAEASSRYPDQDFLVLGGSGLGGESAADVVYRHLEQAFLLGYFAGLAASSEELEGIDSVRNKIVGMIVDLESPRITREIRPGFEIGLHTANPDIRMEFRVIGSRNNTARARQLADRMYASGAEIILTIAGSANRGVVDAAGDADTYVLWFDSEGTSAAPGTVLAGGVIRQDKAAEEWTRQWLEGTLEMGKTTRIGVSEGYIEFPLDTRNIRRRVPKSIRSAMQNVLERMQSGALNLRFLEE